MYFFLSEEHKKCSPKCAYLKVKDPHNITVAEVLDLEKAAIDYYVVSTCHHCVLDTGMKTRGNLVLRIHKSEIRLDGRKKITIIE